MTGCGVFLHVSQTQNKHAKNLGHNLFGALFHEFSEKPKINQISRKRAKQPKFRTDFQNSLGFGNLSKRRICFCRKRFETRGAVSFSIHNLYIGPLSEKENKQKGTAHAARGIKEGRNYRPPSSSMKRSTPF